ncbi:MAG: efflux RND transporter periplasmic adaptor subunit [Pseudomonadota bacterium]
MLDATKFVTPLRINTVQTVPALSAVAFLALLVLAIAQFGFGASEAALPANIHTVSKQSFSVSLHERGIIQPARVLPIKSGIASNQARIVWLQEEGARVKKGDIVARYDTKPFNDLLQKTELKAVDAEASLVAAEKALQLTIKEGEAKIEAAKRKQEIATIKVSDLSEGSGKLEQRKRQNAVSKAQRAVLIAQAELKDFDELFQLGHVSRREREIAADKLRSEREQLQFGQQALSNYLKYEWTQQLRESELQLAAAKEELLRESQTAELTKQRREAELVLRQREKSAALARIAAARRDLEQSDVRAPIEGVLLYSMVPREGTRRKVQVGDAVWFGQTFMEIPDTSRLALEIEVREIDVIRMQRGLEAIVRLDAKPDQAIKGEVSHIGALAKASEQNPNIRSFTARINLAPDAIEGGTVYAGMSASADVIWGSIEQQIAVPTAAIALRGENRVVNVVNVDNDQAHWQIIETGLSNEQWTEVTSGLTTGITISYQ